MTIKKYLALPTLALTVAIPLMATTSTTAHAQRVNNNLRAPAPIVCVFNERGAGRVAIRAREVRQQPGNVFGTEIRGNFGFRSGTGIGRRGAPNMRIFSRNPFDTLIVALIDPLRNIRLTNTTVRISDLRRGQVRQNLSFTGPVRNAPRRSGRLTCRFL